MALSKITTESITNDVAINTSGAITTTGAFTSKGIDDNADANAVTIDSSERLHVGTESLTSKLNVVGDANTTGVSIKSGGNGSVHPFQVTWATGAEGAMLKVDDNGNTHVGIGNLVIGTSGKGIDFSAETNSASGSASAVLDDYEEGTFTAAFTNFSGSATFSNAVYTKIGQMVFFTLHITGKSNTSDGDQMTVSGFPFAVLGEHPASVGMNDNEFGHAMVNTAEYLYFYNLTGGPFTYDMFPHTSGYARIQGAYRIA